MIRFLLILLLVAWPIAPVRAADVPLQVLVDKAETVELSAPASSVFIANPDVADIQVLSPTTVMVFGKKIGETTLMAAGADNQILVRRQVQVGMNVAGVEEALAALLPAAKVNVVGIPDGIMLTGSVNDPSEAEDARRVAARYVPQGGEVINRLQVRASNQIHLRVRVAEVSRTVTRSFGINWDSAMKIGGFAFGIAQGAALAQTGLFGLNTARPGDTDSSNILSFKAGSRDADMNGFIDALAQNGLITILAEPNLTAMSGETAFFLAGGEYPILVPESDGKISVEYKNYGVKLSFTPTLINPQRINIKVRPEVSELSSEGAVTLASVSIPALKVRRAETTVELASGQSFAIAGMLSTNSDQSVDKFPFLGDVPVLGQLFRSTAFNTGETELVIIVTPYTVRPSDTQLALPTDGFTPPSELERLGLQRETSADAAKRSHSGAPVAVMVTPPAPSGDPTPLSAGDGFIVE